MTLEQKVQLSTITLEVVQSLQIGNIYYPILKTLLLTSDFF